MPRPKVKDRDRQRAPSACIPCKHSKIRCDARLPCATCVRKGRIAVCKYLESPGVRRSSATASETAVVREAAPTESTETTQNGRLMDVSASGSLYNEIWGVSVTAQRSLPVFSSLDDQSDHRDQLEKIDSSSDPVPSTASPEATQSRLLLNSKGEKVYIGAGASLSFLQFLRRTLYFHMGSSAFTETNSKDVMLEVEMMDTTSTVTPDPDLSERRHLIQCYYEASSGILDLYSVDELESLAEPSVTYESTAEMYLVLAIGAQCRGHPSDTHHALKCFKRAGQLAFEDMLFNPSINLIKIFLLMSYYMLGACRRNAAFMYLGVAAKAACALGLHSEDYHRDLQPAASRQPREKLWKSLFVLDTIVSSVLGRPSSFPTQELEEPALDSNPITSQSLNHTHIALDASYGASTYLSSLIQHIPGRNNANLADTEQFLERFKKWSQGLHPIHRKLSPAIVDRRTLIGNMHLGCVYYFTVMLATRPFLIAHLVARLQKDLPSNGKNTPNMNAKELAKLAHVCLDAAICVSQLTYKVQQQGSLFGNMCLIKAFVFAAGLLIGFSLFAADTADPDVQAAFNNAQSVLEQLSHLSPQAKHYHDILNDFSTAISKYHRQKLNKKRRVTNQYLDQLFDLGSPPRAVAANTSQQRYLSPISGDGVLHDQGTNIAFMNENPVGFDTDLDFNAMMEMYDPGNLPLVWDDFSYS